MKQYTSKEWGKIGGLQKRTCINLWLLPVENLGGQKLLNDPMDIGLTTY